EAAFEQVIATALEAGKRGVCMPPGEWGPREYVAHMAGWEIMASVRMPRVVAAGINPPEFDDPIAESIMNDAINAAFTTLTGDQSIEALCDTLRAAYQKTLANLRRFDDHVFQPGEYIYERTKDVIEHCKEHNDDIIRLGA